jgi:tetratricopeptide (TPR) repeat protein
MSAPLRLKERYELREMLGQGGMGIVYKAYDSLMLRDVALKTLRDVTGPKELELFQRERRVLATLCHPNIVEIFDIGEFEEDGDTKPFFVMPLLRGQPLERLIAESEEPLSLDRSVEIITQTCRGLHAAHESGLIHRDLKPSNIFVMEDDSVKIIDFGVAHVADANATRSIRGTLLYMAPERLQMKRASLLSDIFSLGVVCYEVFVRRKPFARPTERQIAQAILHEFPAAASEFNPAVNDALSRTINKAMAKLPEHRFSSARDFADTVRKAIRNTPIEYFDFTLIKPRLDLAENAFGKDEFAVVRNVLSELKEEGHLDPAIIALERRTEQGEKQRAIRALLEDARLRAQQNDHAAAMQKVDEVLQIDPGNAAAAGLKVAIEQQRLQRRIDDCLATARRHLAQEEWGEARAAVETALALGPQESRALALRDEIDRGEAERLRVRQEEACRQSADAARTTTLEGATDVMATALISGAAVEGLGTQGANQTLRMDVRQPEPDLASPVPAGGRSDVVTAPVAAAEPRASAVIEEPAAITPLRRTEAVQTIGVEPRTAAPPENFVAHAQPAVLVAAAESEEPREVTPRHWTLPFAAAVLLLAALLGWFGYRRYSNQGRATNPSPQPQSQNGVPNRVEPSSRTETEVEHAVTPEGSSLGPSEPTAPSRAATEPGLRTAPPSRPTQAAVTSGTNAPAGLIEIQANVPQARITVDGKSESDWVTPKTLKVSAGSHQVEVSRPGYETQAEEINVPNGGKTATSFSLQPQSSKDRRSNEP